MCFLFVMFELIDLPFDDSKMDDRITKNLDGCKVSSQTTLD